MTILQAIAALDRSYPNDYSAETKLQWLSDFDGQVKRDVFDTHVGRHPCFSGYGADTDIESTELLIPAPYDEVYPILLALRIHILNGDTARVSLIYEDFTRAYRSFTDWYNRTHLPCGRRALQF